MRLRPDPAVGVARNQGGFALIAVLSLAALISAYLITTALNPTSSDLIREREQRSMNALRQAKAALIAYAASEQWQNSGGVTPFQPGALPCPDRDNNGTAEDREFPQSPCNTALKRIGRFPWKTVGADDLHDASGEPLWYVVSASYLKNTPLYTNVINSDTQGQLTVNGIFPASNVIAIVFAPNDAVQGQSRVSTNAVTYNDPSNFLEQFNPGTYATFNSSALPSDVHNDRLLVITQAELMAAVEPIVAANIERDVKPVLQGYVTAWGRYPFAAPFSSPDPGRAQSEYKGGSGADGLLPITRDPAWVTWDPTSATVVPYHAYDTGTSNLTSVNCGASTATQIVCVVNYSGSFGDRPGIRLQAKLLNGARAFLKPPAKSDTTITEAGPTPGGWSTTLVPDNPGIITQTLLADGNATVAFFGRLTNAGLTNRPVTIRVTVPPYHAISDGADPNSGWFIANEWYRQTYFAVAAGWLPGGAGCSAPNCITVNNLPAWPGYAPADDKHAILTLSGRALNGAIRPTANLGDYLEGENSTPADRTYEHRAGAVGLTASGVAINDKVVVLAP